MRRIYQSCRHRMARNRRGLGSGEAGCEDGQRDVEYRAARDEAAGDGKKIKNMEKNTYQKIYKEAVAIANHASILCSLATDDVKDGSKIRLHEHFDELESLMLEI